MLNFKLCLELREAGFPWHPTEGDFFWKPLLNRHWGEYSLTPEMMGDSVLMSHIKNDCVFSPRLNNLLKAFDPGQVPDWCLETCPDGFKITLWFDQELLFEYTLDTPEGAVAEAVLWYLQNEKRGVVCESL